MRTGKLVRRVVFFKDNDRIDALFFTAADRLRMLGRWPRRAGIQFNASLPNCRRSPMLASRWSVQPITR